MYSNAAEPVWKRRYEQAVSSAVCPAAGTHPNTLAKALQQRAEAGERPIRGLWGSVGMSRAEWQFLLDGRIAPMPSQAHVIALALGLPVEELFPTLNKPVHAVSTD